MAVAAASAGCHVFCEKAIAPDLADADAMIEACERNKVRIAVSHQARYVEPFLTVRAMVRRGDVGRLLSIHGRGKEDARGGGEDMLVLGTHVLDMMRYLAGDPAWVFGHVTLEGREVTRKDAARPTEPIGLVAGDAITAMYAFPNGVRGTFTSIRGQSRHGPRMGVTLVGTDGAIALYFGACGTAKLSRKPVAPAQGEAWEDLKVSNEPDVPGASPLGAIESIPRGNRLAVWDLLRAAEEGREPVSSGRDARSALEMILGVYASHLEGQRLPFPLADRQHPLEPR
jgi:predicted dehydrogenase